MINLKIRGGLGNQLFQYALARNLAIKKAVELNIDYSSYSKSLDTPRNYSLDNFNICRVSHVNSGPIFSILKFINKLSRHGFIPYQKSIYLGKYFFENKVNFNSEVLSLKDGSWLFGFFQSEKYFSDITPVLRSELSFKDINISSSLSTKIKESESVFIHIRRGDYINNPVYANFYNPCSLDYYHHAIDYISQKTIKPKFYIFSDDPKWVKDNLQVENAVYVSDGKLSDVNELQLMSSCKHGIIANSSFSWWGAWLIDNKDKIIIAPKKWFMDDKIDSSDIIPDSWIKL